MTVPGATQAAESAAAAAPASGLAYPATARGDTVDTQFGVEVADPYHWLENDRSEEHTSELQSLMRISYAVFCLKKKKKTSTNQTKYYNTLEQHTNKLNNEIMKT